MDQIVVIANKGKDIQFDSSPPVNQPLYIGEPSRLSDLEVVAGVVVEDDINEKVDDSNFLLSDVPYVVEEISTLDRLIHASKDNDVQNAPQHINVVDRNLLDEDSKSIESIFDEAAQNGAIQVSKKEAKESQEASP